MLQGGYESIKNHPVTVSDSKFGYSHNHCPRAGIMVIISPRAGIMVIISPRADYETFGAGYRNHSTKSARPLSIVKFEFQGDNGYDFRI